MFIPTRDRTLTAAWMALDDATVDNGCLWVLPGSHRRGVIYPNREHSDERLDCSAEAYECLACVAKRYLSLLRTQLRQISPSTSAPPPFAICDETNAISSGDLE
jgi:hypothetical protein